MKRLAGKKLAAVGIAMAMVISSIMVPDQANAAKNAVKKITVNKKKVTLYKGAIANYGSIQITAKISPQKAAKTKAKWKSNKKKVASVNAKGLIMAKNPGKATITVTAGGKSAKVKVTVKAIKKKVTKVTVANKSVTLTKGGTSKIKTTVAPKKATLKSVVYSSANKQIATVSASGEIKGVKAGNTTITVKAADGSKKQAKVSVQVVEPGQGSTTSPVDPATPSVAPAVPSTNPAVPTEAPIEPTEAPVEPTVAPVEPTETPVEPTEAPVEPTEAPVAPTEAPVEPTKAPVEPTVAPTEPYTTQVIGSQDEEYPNNTKFVLNTENTYLSKITVDGKEYEGKVNDATVDLANRAIAKIAAGQKDISVAYGDFLDRSMDATYQVAEDVTVTVTKAAGSNQASVKIGCAYEDIAGEYTFQMAASEPGYAVSLRKKDGSNQASAVIIQPDSNKAEYQVSQIVVIRNNKPVREAQLTGKTVDVTVTESGDITTVYAKSGAYSATATYNEATKAGTFVVTNGADTLAAAYDGSEEYTISIPDRYLKDYGIELFQ